MTSERCPAPCDPRELAIAIDSHLRCAREVHHAYVTLNFKLPVWEQIIAALRSTPSDRATLDLHAAKAAYAQGHGDALEEAAAAVKRRDSQYASGARGVGSENPVGAVLAALETVHYDILALKNAAPQEGKNTPLNEAQVRAETPAVAAPVHAQSALKGLMREVVSEPCVAEPTGKKEG